VDDKTRNRPDSVQKGVTTQWEGSSQRRGMRANGREKNCTAVVNWKLWMRGELGSSKVAEGGRYGFVGNLQNFVSVNPRICIKARMLPNERIRNREGHRGVGRATPTQSRRGEVLERGKTAERRRTLQRRLPRGTRQTKKAR